MTPFAGILLDGLLGVPFADLIDVGLGACQLEEFQVALCFFLQIPCPFVASA